LSSPVVAGQLTMWHTPEGLKKWGCLFSHLNSITGKKKNSNNFKFLKFPFPFVIFFCDSKDCYSVQEFVIVISGRAVNLFIL
jgi:hypothetical protein